MLQRWFAWQLAHPWRCIVVMLLLGVVLAAGMARISFTTDYRVYFGKDNPQLLAFKRMEADFVRSDSVLFAVAPADGRVFTADCIQAIRDMTAAGWKFPYAKGVLSLTNFIEPHAEGDDITANPIIPAGSLAQVDLDAIRAQALANKRLVGGLLAKKGDVAGVAVYLDLPHKHPEAEINEVAAAAHALQRRIEAEHPGIKVYPTGIVMFNKAMSDAVEWDMAHLYPLTYVVMFGILLLYFRSVSMTFTTLMVVVMAVGMAMGFTGWARIELNPTSLSAGVIVLTLGIADCVHLLTSFGHERAQGRERAAAMAESLRINFAPVFVTSLTTAIGFLGMNSSDSPPNRDLGNIVAFGVLCAWLLAVVMLPALMMVLPLRQARSLDRQNGVMPRLAEWIIRHRYALLVGNIVIIATLAACIPLNHFGDNYVKYFSADLPFRRNTEFTNRRLTGQQFVEYAVPSGSAGGVYDPAYLHRLKAFTQWLETQPEVRKVTSLVELLETLNQTMHGGKADAHRLPDSRAAAAQYMLFYEMSLPAGIDLTNLVNLHKSASRVGVTLNTIDSEHIIAFDNRAQAWMQQHFPAAMQSQATSISVLFAHIARRNFTSMISGSLVSFALISLCLIVAFRSWLLGVVSLLPNLVPAIMGFGVWGLLRGSVGMSLSVVLSITLGIVVDDTIHLMSKYRRARSELGMDPADAVRYAFASVGRALWATTVVLVAGFAVMMISSFELTAQLGMLVSIIVALALLADFFFLPPLLMFLERRALHERTR